MSTGPDVKSINKGQRIMLNWAIPCFECFQCKLGNQHLCERNSSVTAGNSVSQGHATFSSTRLGGNPVMRSFSLGTLSEYTLVREAACIPIHVPISFASAAIIGCGVMTGYGSVVNAAKLKPGSSAVVLGTGGVGLNVIQGARIAGAAKIIAIDVNPARLEMAKKYGATDLILADRNDMGLIDASEKVKALTEGRGADYAFECTAVPTLGAAPLAMIRNAGMAIQVSGIESAITIDMNLFEWDKTYINPLYGQSNPSRDFPRLLDLYDGGQLMLDELVTNSYSLDQLSVAFEDMHQGKNAKGVILF
jgi:S-(hydroxymethyl)glutathione dehydrogenase/alcohol dehydrogenase